MRESARYAWWLLIFLFTLIILGNTALFWTLFFQPEGKGLASRNQPLGVEFQVRYALAVERFGLGEETIRSALQSAFEGMEKAFSPYEAAVYRLIVQSAFSAGDPKETLRLLPDLPSERLTAVQRRWQAVRLRDALTRPIAPSQVPTVVDSLGALPSPLARELLEITLYQRAGAADKARALREALAQRAAWGAVLLGAVLGTGCFAGVAGIGILLWYLLARLPLPKRPAPNESPFAYDPLLWALVIFLLLNAPVIRETLLVREMMRGVEVTNALYLLAVLLPLMYLLSLRRESGALGQLRWFQGSVWRQIGVALMGYAACVPFLVAMLCLTALLAPALPAEQTNPISERVSENQGALEWLWTFAQAAVLAPIIEEFVFRGVLFQVFWQRTGRVWLSAFASGYLFAVIHPQFLGGILPITVLGTVLALVYAHTRSLLPCILIHALNNGLIVLMLWSVAG